VALPRPRRARVASPAIRASGLHGYRRALSHLWCCPGAQASETRAGAATFSLAMALARVEFGTRARETARSLAGLLPRCVSSPFSVGIRLLVTRQDLHLGTPQREVASCYPFRSAPRALYLGTTRVVGSRSIGHRCAAQARTIAVERAVEQRDEAGEVRSSTMAALVSLSRCSADRLRQGPVVTVCLDHG